MPLEADDKIHRVQHHHNHRCVRVKIQRVGVRKNSAYYYILQGWVIKVVIQGREPPLHAPIVYTLLRVCIFPGLKSFETNETQRSQSRESRDLLRL